MGGRTSRGREVITRQWRLVEALHGRRRGAGVAQLVKDLGVSRSTLYRDIALLEQAGVRIGRESINGEVRFVLHGEPLPARAPSLR
jgi:predicted DNA-binding transcriptional regulator YafY